MPSYSADLRPLRPTSLPLPRILADQVPTSAAMLKIAGILEP